MIATIALDDGLIRARSPRHATTWTTRFRSDMAAASSTVEALVYSCRQGPAALERPDNLRRLAELSKQQLRDVHARVQRFRPDLQYEGWPVVRWSAEHAGMLLDKWILLNAQR
jgi:hypothetical protein